MAQANGIDIHATGQPDTPAEVVTHLLENALRSDDIKEIKRLVQRSHHVIGGLDPYLDQISTRPSKVSVHTLQWCCPDMPVGFAALWIRFAAALKP